MCALLKRRVEKYHQLTLEGNKMTCCYMTTNETKIKTDKQTNKQTNKQKNINRIRWWNLIISAGNPERK